MGRFGTDVNPAHFVEVASATPGQPERPAAGTKTLIARAHNDLTPLDGVINVGQYGYWSADFPGVDLIDVSADGGVSWVGPLESDTSLVSGSEAGANAVAALSVATEAKDISQQALDKATTGVGAKWGVNIEGQPSVFPPESHSHGVAQINVATFMKDYLNTGDAQAARAAIGAGTGNGTSNLALGFTATTAKPGNWSPAANGVSFAPASGITATTVQGAIEQAAQMGGGGSGGTGAILPVKWASGAYPTQPATAPAGVVVRLFLGPQQYQGPTWAGVLDQYQYALLT